MTTHRSSQWQTDRLAMLLDTLDGVPLSNAERRSLEWLCGFEAHTVENIAAVINRARQTAGVSDLPTTVDLVKSGS